MSRKSKKRDLEVNLRFISQETLNTVLGVLSLVIAIFLLLGAFGSSGRVGTMAYEFFSYLFGVGYYLIPMVFLLLSISFIRERERALALPQIFGSALFFASALGLVNLVSDKGGILGGVISGPLSSLFDVYLTAILLLVLIIISILVIFDINIRVNVIALIKSLFTGRKTKDVEPTAAEEAMINKTIEKNSQPTIYDREQERRQPVKKRDEDDNFTPMMIRRSGKLWAPPPLSLLEGDRGKAGVRDIKANANLIKRTLLNFGIMVEMDEISIGPSVTRYALKPAEGVKLSKILGLQTNLELALAAHPVRIEAPIPGKSLVGIEVPNTAKSMIGLGSLISEPGYTETDKPLLVALGKDITGQSIFDNLSKMPHLLI